MIILISYTSATYKAQIRSSVETGFRQLYTGSCSAGPHQAAKRLVEKNFGPAAAQSVHQLKDATEIKRQVGKFFDDPKRKQVFDVYTFIP